MDKYILALCFLLIASPALAQKRPKSADEVSTGRAAMLQSLKRGKEITAGDKRYLYLPEVRAIEGKAAGEVIETKGKLLLYRGAATDSAALRRTSGTIEYPTVINARTGTLGVLTGVLVVRPRSMADADAIASAHGLETAKAYPQLQTVFYKAKEGADIADASAALQADSRVEIAYPEIIEHVRVPK